MEARRFRSLGGGEFEISFRPPSRSTSHYCLALHKSGSVLFDNLVAGLCEAAGQSAVAFEPQAFKQGIVPPQFDTDALEFLGSPGFVFYGFRGPWRMGESPQFRSAPKLLLVRDPRDIAVSFYHSQRSSHWVPDEGKARDGILALREKALEVTPSQFVLQGKMDFILANYEAYAALCAELPAWKVWRYEDIVYAKRDWAREIAARLDLDVPDATLERIVARQDLFPESEDPTKHVRRVHPGGWREVLDDAALAHIAKRSVKAGTTFGYNFET
jgi:hypothetical protein